MKKTITTDSPEYKTFVDFWNLYKEYGIPEDNDDYWNKLTLATQTFYLQHDKTYLAKKLAQLVADVAEHDLKNMKK